MSTPGFNRAPLTDEVEVVVIGGGFGGLLAGARLREAGVEDDPHHREGRRLRRHLVLEPLSGRGLRHRELHLPAAARRDRLHAGREVLARAGDPRPQPRASASTSTSTSNACFQTEVTELRWDEEVARWIVETNRGDAMKARFVVMANGPLHRPKLPGIPGVETLQGPLLPHQPLGLRLHRRRLRWAGSTG